MEDTIYTVYILYSHNYDKIYIGYTNNLIARFHSHNSLSSKGYTKRFRPWIVALTEIYYSKPHAIKREKQLKSAQGRAFIWKYIDRNKESW